jgi:hypothetical protein
MPAPTSKVLDAIKSAPKTWSKADAQELESLITQLRSASIDTSAAEKARLRAQIKAMEARRAASDRAELKQAAGPVREVKKSTEDQAAERREREKYAAARKVTGGYKK